MYNLIEFGILMNLVKLMKLCLNETYSRIWGGKQLSDMFPIKNGLKQGDFLLPLVVNFAVESTSRRVQVNQGGLKTNGTRQLLIYADVDNILGRSVQTMKKNTELLVVASKETGLEGNVEKTKYMVMARDQNARQHHNTKIRNECLKGWKSSNIWEQP